MRVARFLILSALLGTAPLPEGFGQDQVSVVPAPTDASETKSSRTNEEKRLNHLEKMTQVMGKLPDRPGSPPEYREIGREQLDGYSRVKLQIIVDESDSIPAWLLLPDDAVSAPAMLCLHQTVNIGKDEPVGLGKQESKRQALHLVKRGYVCLAPDYPSFGEYPFDFRKAFEEGRFESGTMKAIWNNMRCIDLLQAMDEVDPDRIGVIGHSLGGHNSLFTAAFDPRLKVAVSSCGFCSFHKYYGGNLKGWTSERYMPAIATRYGNDPTKVPFDFEDVLLAIYPRGIFAMAPQRDDNFDVTGVQDVIDKVMPTYRAAGILAKLRAVYPDALHEWPEEQRLEAYEFIDSILKSPTADQ